MGTASAVETSATVEAASTMKASAAMEPASTVKAIAAVEPASIMKAFPAEATSKVPAIIEVAATVKPRVAVEAVEPRARADKNAAGEVARAVITVRRARVRIISIVAVLAHWGWTVIRRAETDADHDSLCMCVRRCQQANRK